MSASRPAVAITGIGAVSPFGVGRLRFWNAILAGESGVTAFEGVDERHWTSRVAARVDEDAIALAEASLNGQYLGADGRADPKRYAKVSRIAVLAAREALEDSGLGPVHDIGVVVGSGAGGIDVAERQYGDFYSG